MKNINSFFFLSQVLVISFVFMVMIPGQKTVADKTALLFGMGAIELFYFYKIFRTKVKSNAPSDILILVMIFMLLWELFTTQLNQMHPVLVPAPEDVFNVFATKYEIMLIGVISSMELLLLGTLLGISLGLGLGLLVGWIPRLRDTFYPIANVLTPIPPVVFAPYLIALMPTFRSASVIVIFLGIFWPTFLSIIIRVSSMDRRILDLARVMNVNNWTMIWKILLPYTIPGVISGLKVTLTTSVIMLTFAEMMGATRGMGFFIVNNAYYANYANVVAGIILVGIVVTLLSWLVSWVQTHTIRWNA